MTTDISKKTWIQTASGKHFNFLKPEVKDICLEDIATGLSNICRFSGQLKNHFYSVAEHSVLVSWLCVRDPIAALLHDASEAYCVDVPNPLKIAMREYDMVGAVNNNKSSYDIIEDSVHSCVAERYNLKPDDLDKEAVARADRQAFLLEAQLLFPGICEEWPGFNMDEFMEADRKLSEFRGRAAYCMWRNLFGLEPKAARALFLDEARYLGLDILDRAKS